MFAHRVGVIGALIAVIVLSLELGGALAWKHHAQHDARWQTLRGTELTLRAMATHQLDSTLEQVTLARQSLE